MGAIIVFDITKKESFVNVYSWINELRTKGPEGLIILLVGNKTDLAEQYRDVDTDDAKFLADNNGLSFIEASAKDGSNID